MSIIVTERGKKPRRIDPSDFALESNLQALIHENPETIPLYEIKEDVKLLILAREFETESGPIDAVGTDRDGEIYIIETKLYKNPDKRGVVAQALDYGAALWRHGSNFAEFAPSLDESVREKFGVGLREKLSSYFALDEAGTDALLERMSRNLSDGRFKFIVPMDKLHEPLKDLIIFLNQNSNFDVFAVELEFYKLDEREIIIPKLFGAEVKKSIGAAAPTERRRWSEEDVLADARAKMTAEEFAAFESIYRFAKENADEIRTGTGSYGTLSPIFKKLSSKSLFTIGADKRLSFNFEWIGREKPGTRDRLKEELEKIGFRFGQDYRETRPSFPPEDWAPKVGELVAALGQLL